MPSIQNRVKVGWIDVNSSGMENLITPPRGTGFAVSKRLSTTPSRLATVYRGPTTGVFSVTSKPGAMYAWTGLSCQWNPASSIVTSLRSFERVDSKSVRKRLLPASPEKRLFSAQQNRIVMSEPLSTGPLIRTRTRVPFCLNSGTSAVGTGVGLSVGIGVGTREGTSVGSAVGNVDG